MLAHKYGYESLAKTIAKRELPQKMHSPCTHLLRFTCRKSATQLKELNDSCIDEIDEHATEILESEGFLHLSIDKVKEATFRDTSELSILNGLIKWTKHNMADNSDEYVNLFKNVNLSLIMTTILWRHFVYHNWIVRPLAALWRVKLRDENSPTIRALLSHSGINIQVCYSIA